MRLISVWGNGEKVVVCHGYISRKFLGLDDGHWCIWYECGREAWVFLEVRVFGEDEWVVVRI
jgi:hypothetical protein